MPCTQIHQLQELLSHHEPRPSNSDLIAVVCGHCDEQEVCPDLSVGELDESAAAVTAPAQTQSEGERR